MATQPALATSPPEFDITDNTITFYFNDWYQVQNETNYSVLCEGNAICTVPSGTYLITNHTRHERFSGIEIGIVEPVGNGFIEFADDGWYQLQDMTTFETLCEGLRECVVPAGTYLVINHTTGQRTTETIEPAGLFQNYDFSFVGNLAMFLTDDWYEVQTTSNFRTVCEGNDSCEVPIYDYYNVINHTTGQRWDDIYVGSDE